MRSSVVLPEPDGPSSATSSPDLISSETPCSAGVSPKAFSTFSTDTSTGLPHFAVGAPGAACARASGVIHIISDARVHHDFSSSDGRCAAISPA